MVSETDPTSRGLTTERTYAQLPDGEIAKLMRAGARAAPSAVKEFLRRHHPAVRVYARLCAATETAARQLATEALDFAVREAKEGIEPPGTLRQRAMILVQQTSATWIADGLAGELDPVFVAWLDSAGATSTEPDAPDAPPAHHPPAVRQGFHSLPERTRSVLWYALVEQEADADVATWLGVTADIVEGMRDRALEAMRQAFLRIHLEREGNGRCRGFQRIIEAAARPGDMRCSEDFVEHLEHCPCCTVALSELTRMWEEPRTTLAEALLEWGAAAYVAAAPSAAAAPAGAPFDPPDEVPAADELEQSDTVFEPVTLLSSATTWTPGPVGRRPSHRRTSRLSCSVAVVAAGAALAMALLAAGHSAHETTAHRRPVPAPPAPVSTPSPTASPSISLSPSSAPSAPPSPSTPPTAVVTGVVSPDPSSPAPAPPAIPADSYAQVVNVQSGLCLDIANGYPEQGRDVVTAQCGSQPTQEWRLDARGLVHSYADPDYCLDSRGSTDRGVGVWTCSAIDSDAGVNLLFTVDSQGLIRPQIAEDHALTPTGGAPGATLGLCAATGRSDQRWSAGSPPA